MPELPEVETIARGLREWGLAGARMERVQLLREDVANVGASEFERRLRGRKVTEVCRRGKNLVLHVEGNVAVVMHLGMSGQVLLAERKAPRTAHTHLAISFANRDRELRFRDARRFGFVRVYECGVGETPGCLLGLGPEPAQIGARELGEIAEGSRRAIKNVLMDQRKIAGIGNIYADEILHRAGISPTREANGLSKEETGRLGRAMRTVLAEAIRCGGSSVSDYVLPTGKLGYFQERHRVYGKEGERCPRCGEVIRRIVLGGRGTHYCATCQR